MFLKSYFKVNTEKVIQEMVEGEVIIINLEKGYYYSLSETGGDVWMGIESGLSGENIIAKMQAGYNADNGFIEGSIQKLLSELINEEIVLVSESSDSNTPGNNDFQINNQGKSFTAPALEKYTDMEDLLLLDPIHDVDEQGWPNVPQGPRH